MNVSRSGNLVIFPTNNPSYINTNEGGMIVKLVVCNDDKFGMCIGSFVIDVLNGSFVGDCELRNGECSVRHDVKKSEQFHFPYLHDDNTQGMSRFLSRNYSAVLVLGSTDWSGWDDVNGRYWVCKYNDLSDDGKSLCKYIESIYQGQGIYLMTFLDT